MRRLGRKTPAACVVLALSLALAVGLLPVASATGQGADGPELTVHRLIKPKNMNDFIKRGERAVVSCDVDCSVVMRLVASRRVARALGHPNSRVIAKNTVPIFAQFRARIAARPRGIVKRRLQQGVMSSGFSFKIRFRAFPRVG